MEKFKIAFCQPCLWWSLLYSVKVDGGTVLFFLEARFFRAGLYDRLLWSCVLVWCVRCEGAPSAILRFPQWRRQRDWLITKVPSSRRTFSSEGRYPKRLLRSPAATRSVLWFSASSFLLWLALPSFRSSELPPAVASSNWPLELFGRRHFENVVTLTGRITLMWALFSKAVWLGLNRLGVSADTGLCEIVDKVIWRCHRRWTFG